MNWNTQTILNSLRLGEDSNVEFKEILLSEKKIMSPNCPDIAKELSAMANASGGIVVFGVRDDPRALVGIPLDRLEQVETFISEICQDSIDPPLPVRLTRREMDTSDGDSVAVIVAEVERGLFVHKAPDGYYRRSGGSYVRPMALDYVLRLQQQRSLSGIKRFEQLPVPQSSRADLVPEFYEKFTSELEEDTGLALRKRHLLTLTSDGEERATVAGILMASRDPRKFFPNAYIEAVSYRGTEQNSNSQIDAAEITGPLDQQIQGAMTFFRRNHRIAAVKEPDRRNVPQFSEQAVFEALVNAVAHRDYQVESMKIRFFIFEDRLLITSPGSLVNSQTVETIPLVTATRNELLTNFLRECELSDGDRDRYLRRSLMERRGDGVKIILSESEKLSGKKPRYEAIEELELQLTIFSADLPNQEPTATES